MGKPSLEYPWRLYLKRLISWLVVFTIIGAAILADILSEVPR